VALVVSNLTFHDLLVLTIATRRASPIFAATCRQNSPTYIVHINGASLWRDGMSPVDQTAVATVLDRWPRLLVHIRVGFSQQHPYPIQTLDCLARQLGPTSVIDIGGSHVSVCPLRFDADVPRGLVVSHHETEVFRYDTSKGWPKLLMFDTCYDLTAIESLLPPDPGRPRVNGFMVTGCHKLVTIDPEIRTSARHVVVGSGAFVEPCVFSAATTVRVCGYVQPSTLRFPNATTVRLETYYDCDTRILCPVATKVTIEHYHATNVWIHPNVTHLRVRFTRNSKDLHILGPLAIHRLEWYGSTPVNPERFRNLRVLKIGDVGHVLNRAPLYEYFRDIKTLWPLLTHFVMQKPFRPTARLEWRRSDDTFRLSVRATHRIGWEHCATWANADKIPISAAVSLASHFHLF
jgi:hypothetical protein